MCHVLWSVFHDDIDEKRGSMDEYDDITTGLMIAFKMRRILVKIDDLRIMMLV